MFIFKKNTSNVISSFDDPGFNKNTLKGEVVVPGDKSMSQRALIIGLISIGKTTIRGILDSEDVYFTMKAIECLGAKVSIDNDNKYISVLGVGIGNLVSPKKPIYMGNSGTGTRLLIGVVSGSNATVTFYGDKSLSKRPMDRIIEPLTKMGASFIFSEDKKLPITVIGARKKGITMPIKYKIPVASAQIKSALILCALSARGTTTVQEPYKSRSYTEDMLKKCGVDICSKNNKKLINTVRVNGLQYLKSFNFTISGDPSSSAFIVIACLITKGSKVTVKNILKDSMRLNIFKVLKKMGAKVILEKKSSNLCDIKAEYSELKNIKLKKSDVTSLIDEFPILSIAAACGKGKMIMQGLGELRYKESDRFKAISEGLKKCGIEVNTYKDDMEITGSKKITGDAKIVANNDHRIAMSFNILNLVARKPIRIVGNKSINSSFPNFFETIRSLQK
jgi:3-phosphoshikimate 1-carboxyvinyltransferase